jgi:hypothetical protein
MSVVGACVGCVEGESDGIIAVSLHTMLVDYGIDTCAGRRDQIGLHGRQLDNRWRLQHLRSKTLQSVGMGCVD